ncbi:NAD(P)/FAD-dependent oxidoreductase [Sporolactobacillus terrae]|uniref:NAD(P)/FAD-dependent oxidoreductase n=1 Tax=Sporolactobacillus terrae TaxID=269673 RepID=A0ABX5QAV0_9BACL|nr:NAD(P)/FAD-dependent oxidoreductase [Sporolactobacillus terrae]QAA23803.1 NAD(P)/FAD-dependent oxidoreductase [Sporolactobacillus terrae]QAA26774.1 NAD(P)/FAD-dependent oxidoreductase [Sporolactobacillus terrae]UAK15840.1 NAD(P)/FAD-dependent oxidoreductase [Sporolactobacillus terrae]
MRKRIVILGAGYGGLRTLKRLQRMKPNAALILIDKNNYHCEKTSLHEVAAGTADADEICYSLQQVIDPKRTQFVQDTVLRVVKKTRMILLQNHDPVSYDYLVIGLGFVPEYYGIEGMDRFGLAISDIPSVIRIRNHIEEQFKAWTEDQRSDRLVVAVGGAGFTSFEFLGELTHRIPELITRYQVDAKQVRIVCIEPTPKALPMFNRRLAAYGSRKLRDRGVDFLIGRVCGFDGAKIYYRTEEHVRSLKAGTFVWTGGVSGSAVVRDSGFEERRGRVRVMDDLSVPDHPEILIIGDCSAVIDPGSGQPYPTTAQIALQQADCAAYNVKAMLDDRPTKPFVFKFKGTVCSLGRDDAVGEVMGKGLKGRPASVMKKVIENRSLVKIGGVETMLKKGRFS